MWNILISLFLIAGVLFAKLQQLNSSVLKTCINYQHDKFQPMSIALPTAVISDIIKIQNSTNEQKQRYIENKLEETNLCEGYFFNNDTVLSSTSFR